MYKEIVHIKSVQEIEEILFKHTDGYFFTDNELKSVEHKNKIKSTGARYLIKKSILDHLKLSDDYHDIEIENEADGKPVVRLTRKVRKKAEEMNIGNIQISISHSRNLISTLVVVEENV
ncbi:MAG: hypothetical protein KOO66_10535 [Bacteroidales bacterium]|nr:hypothetical protein [Bacteroidales bacterium]